MAMPATAVNTARTRETQRNIGSSLALRKAETLEIRRVVLHQAKQAACRDAPDDVGNESAESKQMSGP
jgi:hypothetical protein